jgi:hypothetical protein
VAFTPQKELFKIRIIILHVQNSKSNEKSDKSKQASELPDFRETYSPDAKNAKIYILNKKICG